MRLQSIDGATTFDLEIVRYQFPELESDEWDSNWLVISGSVVSAARSWNFFDPCLVTMEAHDLANWLAALANGRPTKERIFFTEPNLSFEAVAADAQSAELRVYFSLESKPPNVEAEIDEFFELFKIARNDLAQAARDLCRSLRRFPVRAGARLGVPPCTEA
jgi:hypothetical protein